MAIETESIASDLPVFEHQQRNTCVEKHRKQTKEKAYLFVEDCSLMKINVKEFYNLFLDTRIVKKRFDFLSSDHSFTAAL
nr:hypothetical protein Iba_chr05eCG2690 [Ipomoea batatas]GMD11736.1 hypothetical protein Iba_chr06fCG6560 [Ipomoea batatas]GMD20269.1 hypothetical protein Iba_chr07fCG3260 [Ipomoea batatas]GMD42640.1 hypothetical protein Iba_chr10bCG11290 [Ipomoea batatas]GMD77242.1 hypothetical protein Iba_chr13cCG1450 [Ipomoea batatas]